VPFRLSGIGSDSMLCATSLRSARVVSPSGRCTINPLAAASPVRVLAPRSLAPLVRDAAMGR